VIFASLQGEIATQRAKELVELSARTTKPILAAWSAREKFAADAYRLLKEGKVPRFSTPVSCGKALAALTTFAEAQRRRAKEKAEPVLALDRPEAKAMLAGRSTDLAEYQAKALVAAYGIPVTREVLAKDPATAPLANNPLMFPDAAMQKKLHVFGPLGDQVDDVGQVHQVGLVDLDQAQPLGRMGVQAGLDQRTLSGAARAGQQHVVRRQPGDEPAGANWQS
jgi:acyl-CoA synthetase (NDP forming)